VSLPVPYLLQGKFTITAACGTALAGRDAARRGKSAVQKGAGDVEEAVEDLSTASSN
jgi:hypothetical protein